MECKNAAGLLGPFARGESRNLEKGDPSVQIDRIGVDVLVDRKIQSKTG